MVAAQDVHLAWVLDLQCEQQADRLDALSSPVYVVPQEQVARLRRQPSVFEQSQHVVVLPVDVTADLERCAHLQQHGLFEEDGLDHANESQDVCLLERY